MLISQDRFLVGGFIPPLVSPPGKEAETKERFIRLHADRLSLAGVAPGEFHENGKVYFEVCQTFRFLEDALWVAEKRGLPVLNRETLELIYP